MKVTHKLAVLAATLAIGSAAQAQSSVTLYGLIDGGLSYQNISGEVAGRDIGSSKIGTQSGAYLPTLFGIRGVEDLGNGNSAVFVLENGFDLGNGTTNQGGRLFGRQATLGVRNDVYGQVDVGRQSNVASRYFLAIDPFGMAYTQAGAGAAFGSANSTRYSNSLMYQSPSYAGVSGALGYSFNTSMAAVYGTTPVADSSGFSTTNNMRATTAGLKYANGPLLVAATYDLVNPNGSIPGAPNVSAWTLAGAYDFSVVKVSAAYGQSREGFMSGITPAANLQSNWSNGGVIFQNGTGANSYLLGASIPVNGASKVMVSYTGLAPTGNWNDNGAKTQSVYNLGYQYDFSKRTAAYAYASYANNYAMLDGVKSTLVTVGLTHKF